MSFQAQRQTAGAITIRTLQGYKYSMPKNG